MLRRTWVLVVLAVAAGAILSVAALWYTVVQADDDTPIGPAPPWQYEFHMCDLRLVVNNLRSTSVAIDITVDGQDFYSGTVAPNNQIATDPGNVGWMDMKNATSHDHEAAIIITYDGLIHADSVTVHPSGSFEQPQSFSYTID